MCACLRPDNDFHSILFTRYRVILFYREPERRETGKKETEKGKLLRTNHFFGHLDTSVSLVLGIDRYDCMLRVKDFPFSLSLFSWPRSVSLLSVSLYSVSLFSVSFFSVSFLSYTRFIVVYFVRVIFI